MALSLTVPDRVIRFAQKLKRIKHAPSADWIENNFTLGEAQQQIYNSWIHRHTGVLLAGRRFGKTWLCLKLLLVHALRKKGRYLYLAPTFGQAYDICWEDLADILVELNCFDLTIINKSTLTIRFWNGSSIMLKASASEAVKRLRGIKGAGAVIDETSDADAYAIDYVLRNCLADSEGFRFYTGTPQGYDHFYDTYQRVKEADPDAVFHYTTMDGGRVPPAEIERIKAEVSPRVWKQENLAEFCSLEGLCYRYFDPEHNVYEGDEIPVDCYPTVCCSADFNVQPAVGHIAYLNNGALYIQDEIVLTDESGTPRLAEAIRGKLPPACWDVLANMPPAIRDIYDWNVKTGNGDDNKALIKQFTPAIRCHCDPTGGSRNAANPTVTNFKVLESYGLTPDPPPPIQDNRNAIETCNGFFENVNGDRRVFINRRCTKTIKALTIQQWTPAGTPEKNMAGEIGFVDHVNDSVKYLILGVFGRLGHYRPKGYMAQGTLNV